MNVRSELLEIIKENESLINNEEFDKLYYEVSKHRNLVPSELTQLLYKAGINPLEHMKYIPKHFLSFSKIKEFNIPKNIEDISDNAFWGCISLTSIIIPDSVVSMGSTVFGSCKSLKDVKLPDSLQHIGEGTFSHCDNLSNINISKNLTHLPDHLFLFCSSLTEIDISNIETIGQAVFSGCDNLKTIKLGINLKSINLWAIPNEVESIYYAGTVEEWKKVDKRYMLNKIVHCKDGDVNFVAI